MIHYNNCYYRNNYIYIYYSNYDNTCRTTDLEFSWIACAHTFYSPQIYTIDNRRTDYSVCMLHGVCRAYLPCPSASGNRYLTGFLYSAISFFLQ